MVQPLPNLYVRLNIIHFYYLIWNLQWLLPHFLDNHWLWHRSPPWASSHQRGEPPLGAACPLPAPPSHVPQQHPPQHHVATPQGAPQGGKCHLQLVSTAQSVHHTPVVIHVGPQQELLTHQLKLSAALNQPLVAAANQQTKEGDIVQPVAYYQHPPKHRTSFISPSIDPKAMIIKFQVKGSLCGISSNTNGASSRGPSKAHLTFFCRR